MARASHREQLLRSIEDDIYLMECRIGHFAASAALGSARGLARQAGQARVKLATAAETLAELRALRERLLRLDQARGE